MTDRDRALLLADEVQGGFRFTYREAAERFLAWLQEHDETGEMSSRRLAGLYFEFCEVEGLAALPENYLFQALGRLEAVTKHKRRVHRRGGARGRVVTYVIPRGGAPGPAATPAAMRYADRRAA